MTEVSVMLWYMLNRQSCHFSVLCPARSLVRGSQVEAAIATEGRSLFLDIPANPAVPSYPAVSICLSLAFPFIFSQTRLLHLPYRQPSSGTPLLPMYPSAPICLLCPIPHHCFWSEAYWSSVGIYGHAHTGKKITGYLVSKKMAFSTPEHFLKLLRVELLPKQCEAEGILVKTRGL